MHGCKNGGWMMGTSHNNSDLPPTIVGVHLSFVSRLIYQLLLLDTLESYLWSQSFGVYNQSIYNQSASQKHRINVSVTTAAEVLTLTHSLIVICLIQLTS